MPVGDSITAGYSSDPAVDAGWRAPLYQSLTNAGYAFQFVGVTNVNPGRSLPTEPVDQTWHCGGMAESAWTYAVRDNIGGWLTKLADSGKTPAVIAMATGVNDINDNNAPGSVSNVSSIIETVHAMAPATRLFVAKITPVFSPDNAWVAAYNAGLAALVSQKRAAGRKVALVDLNTGFPFASGMTADTVHPNAVGYAWLAQQWYSALTAPTALTVTVIGPTNGATVGVNFTIDATATGDGTVTNVAFYDGATQLGSGVTAPPYRYVWLGASEGAHALTAVAWDDQGHSATSAVVTVTVTPSPAGVITWGGGQNIAGDSDVLTTGTPMYGYGFGSDAPFPFAVNGVSFAWGNQNGGLGNGTDVSFAFTGDHWCGPYFPPPVNPTPAGGDYNGLLHGAVWAGGPYTLTLANLTAGVGYAVQVWSRQLNYPTQYITLDGAVTLQASGQYAIGYFTADGTGRQAISLSGVAPQINALQVRRLSEPGTTTTTTTTETTTTTAGGTTTTVAVTTTTTTTTGVAVPGVITWGAAQNIVDDSDVLTPGTPVYAYAFGNYLATFPITVAGVNFYYANNNASYGAVGDPGNLSFPVQPGYGGDYFPPTAYTGYDGILHGAVWGGPWTLGLEHLTPGVEYAVQLWCRQSNFPFQDTTLDGAVTLSASGQYAVGTFTADGTGSQAISVAGNGAQINALQVRRLSEPGTTTTTTTTETTTTTAGGTTTTVAVTTTTTTAAAAPGVIAWGGARNIVDDSDVLTAGALVYAYHFGNGGDVDLNDVTFVGGGIGGGGTNLSFGYTSASYSGPYFGPDAGLSIAYNTILTGANWTYTAFPLTLGNLTAGATYAVQVWSNNNNPNTGPTDYTSLDGGVSLLGKMAGNGDRGQYAIGYFTAAGMSQVIAVGGVPQGIINALQVRVLPERGTRFVIW